VKTFQNSINGLQCRFIGAAEQRGESRASGLLTSNPHSQDGSLPDCNIPALLTSQTGCYASDSQSHEIVHKNRIQELRFCNHSVPFNFKIYIDVFPFRTVMQARTMNISLVEEGRGGEVDPEAV
jgi:hypothetical protein